MEAQSGLAEVSLETRDFSTVEQVANSAIAMNPQFANAYIWRGMAEGNKKAFDKADADFHQAIKLDPKELRRPISNWHSCDCSSRRFPRPRRFSNRRSRSIRTPPELCDSWLLLMLVEKQPAQAISRVQAQIAKSPQNSDMYDLLADLQTGHRRLQRSARLGREGDAAQPGR